MCVNGKVERRDDRAGMTRRIGIEGKEGGEYGGGGEELTGRPSVGAVTVNRSQSKTTRPFVPKLTLNTRTLTPAGHMGPCEWANPAQPRALPSSRSPWWSTATAVEVTEWGGKEG